MLFFAVWAGAQAPPKQQKKTRPCPNSKKMSTHPPLPSVLLLQGRVGLFIFLLFGRWACFCFCCLGECVFFLFCCCLGGVRFYVFAVWVGGFFWLFGRGTGVHSLTGLPGSSSSDSTTKKTKQQKKKKNTGSPQPACPI